MVSPYALQPGPGIGVFPALWEFRAINASGENYLLGEIGQFDVRQTNSGTTTFVPGGENSVWGRLILPEFVSIQWVTIAPYAVAREDILDGEEGLWAVSGQIPVRLEGGTTVLGNVAYANPSGADVILQRRFTIASQAAKCIGWPLQAGISAGELCIMHFHGLGAGMGSNH